MCQVTRRDRGSSSTQEVVTASPPPLLWKKLGFKGQRRSHVCPQMPGWEPTGQSGACGKGQCGAGVPVPSAHLRSCAASSGLQRIPSMQGKVLSPSDSAVSVAPRETF